MLWRQIPLCVLENFCENLCFCNRILSQQHVVKNQIRQNLCDLSRRTSQQQIPSCVLENFCENLCFCNRILSQQHVAKSKSDRICATCCVDKIMLQRQRFSQNFSWHEGICRCDESPQHVAATSRQTCTHGVICRRDLCRNLSPSVYRPSVFEWPNACEWRGILCV